MNVHDRCRTVEKMADGLDYFSRQRAVPDWHQPLIEQQRALVLGVGGIGCTVAKELWYVSQITWTVEVL